MHRLVLLMLASAPVYAATALAPQSQSFHNGAGDFDVEAAKDALEQSRDAWQRILDTEGGDYSFSLLERAFDAARDLRTTLRVQAGRVVERTLSVRDPGDAVERFRTEWTERGLGIGEHAQGAAPATMGAAYEQCSDEILRRDPSQHWLFLSFDELGLLANCTSFPKACVDDCEDGVIVRDLEIIPEAPPAETATGRSPAT